MLEAIDACERIAGRELDWELSSDARIGDHRWWISDLGEFQRDYPGLEAHPRHRVDPSEIHDLQRRAVGERAGMKLSVVIPAHNEAGSIAECLRNTTEILTGAGIDYEILVIDDASTDGTSAVVESLGGVRRADPLLPLPLQPRLRAHGAGRPRPLQRGRGGDHDGRRVR